MELCKFSMSSFLCLALFFCLLISSKSLSSVGSSNRQQGQELVFSNQGRIHSLWNWCLQGNSFVISSCSILFKQIGHSPSSFCFWKKNLDLIFINSKSRKQFMVSWILQKNERWISALEDYYFKINTKRESIFFLQEDRISFVLTLN